MVNSSGDQALHLTFQQGTAFREISHLLVRRDASLKSRSSSGKTPIHLAIAHEYNQLAKDMAIIDQGSGLNIADLEGNTPLHLVSNLIMDDLIHCFLDCGADPNVQNEVGESPAFVYLLRVAQLPDEKLEDDTTVLQHLQTLNHYFLQGLRPGIVRKTDNQSLLHAACLTNCAPIVKAVLSKQRSMIDVQDSQKKTCLHLCVGKWSSKYQVSMVSMLLRAGASINILVCFSAFFLFNNPRMPKTRVLFISPFRRDMKSLLRFSWE